MFEWYIAPFRTAVIFDVSAKLLSQCYIVMKNIIGQITAAITTDCQTGLST